MTSRKLLAIGIALGVVAAVLLNVYVASIERRERSVRVLQLDPSMAVSSGETLELEHVKILELPERLGDVLSRALPATPEARHWIQDRPVTRDIGAGELLLYEHFEEGGGSEFATEISAGRRALSVPVDAATAVSYLLEPGSRVDVLATLRGQEGNARPGISEPPHERISTRTLLQNVRVLAVGRATSRGSHRKADKRRVRTVTLEVSPLEAETLVFALQNPDLRGGLTLALRNPEDEARASLTSVSWKSLAAED